MAQRTKAIIQRLLTLSAIGVGLMVFLVACASNGSGGSPTPQGAGPGTLLPGGKYTPVPITACGGTLFPPPDQWQPAPAIGCLPTRTPVAVSGPTLGYDSQQVALDILNTLPKQLQNMTLETDPKKTRVAVDQSGKVVGVVGVYALNGDTTSELYVSVWITPTDNDAEDRFLLQYHKMNDIYGFPTTAGEIGDKSFIAPEAKQTQQDLGFINQPVWGSARFRNVEFDMYPTKNLTDKLSTFSAADATQIQTAIFNALPK